MSRIQIKKFEPEERRVGVVPTRWYDAEAEYRGLLWVRMAVSKGHPPSWVMSVPQCGGSVHRVGDYKTDEGWINSQQWKDLADIVINRAARRVEENHKNLAALLDENQTAGAMLYKAGATVLFVSEQL